MGGGFSRRCVRRTLEGYRSGRSPEFDSTEGALSGPEGELPFRVRNSNLEIQAIRSSLRCRLVRTLPWIRSEIPVRARGIFRFL